MPARASPTSIPLSKTLCKLVSAYIRNNSITTGITFMLGSQDCKGLHTLFICKVGGFSPNFARFGPT